MVSRLSFQKFSCLIFSDETLGWGLRQIEFHETQDVLDRYSLKCSLALPDLISSAPDGRFDRGICFNRINPLVVLLDEGFNPLVKKETRFVQVAFEL
jgi:hypothetical protein